MKKIILLFFSLIFAVVLVSCGECEHADENNDGACDLCGYDYGHAHTYDEVWSYNTENHWQNVTCGHNIDVKDNGAHVDENNDGICDTCAWDYDHEHTYETKWSFDAENHWHGLSCNHSVEVKDKSAHVDENNDGICDTCAWDYDHEHTYETKWSFDAENHWHGVSCTHSVDVKDKGVHADENNDGICDTCAWNYNHEHTYEQEWSYDKNNHWQDPSCSHEVEIINKAPHSDSNGDGCCDICDMRAEEEAPATPDIEYPEIEF